MGDNGFGSTDQN
ncbi:unnamed protein product [Tuber melanosporum]|uniref:(Perigord truffle) hypothetical protein n=1 Tax=Tuber melanosporum (strain Mel28) TaxID=656061 RepID=D5G6V3_TUBMM|nr:unnamed protein product [Tuber melanosporum]